jgi:1,4-dihydroxy-6-naphthoate synthase
MQKQKITIYHSPDADDAFMFYGLTSGAVNNPDFEFDHDLSDIQSLNEKAIKSEIDVTAVSVHAFAYLKNQYVILSCGASMGGKDYGPRLVSAQDFKGQLADLKRIAIPGKHTSATLALQMMMSEKGLKAELINYDFKDVFRAISAKEVDAGVIIHEGQLTYDEENLKLIIDLGSWWHEKTKLPLPLGVNIAARSLGIDAIQASVNALYSSISYSLANREAALDYAMRYARGIRREDANTFVGMYVNDLTLNLGSEGEKAIRLFLEKAAQLNLIPEMPLIEFASATVLQSANSAAAATV